MTLLASLRPANQDDRQQEATKMMQLACQEDPSFLYQSLGSSSQPTSPASSARSSPSCSSSSSSSSSKANKLRPRRPQQQKRRASRKLAWPSSQCNQDSDYLSASPSCASALDYCHLWSSSPLGQLQLESVEPSRKSRRLSPGQQASGAGPASRPSSPAPSWSALGCATTRQAPDPVYQDDQAQLVRLLVRERAELTSRAALQAERAPGRGRLAGQERHSLLSWMLRVCEHQACQDEIFPLACQVLDKYLALRPSLAEQAERALAERQVYLAAACSLLLAAKLRQTARLPVQALLELSASELAVPLSRPELLQSELLLLVSLKWDLASLVAPNDYLGPLVHKCKQLIGAPAQDAPCNRAADQQNEATGPPKDAGRCDESKVRKHTQMLLELCLMDSQLSQYPPSILAMSSMAVAIDGLTASDKEQSLTNIVSQIHQATHNVNELELMIDVACQIENYVQNLLDSTHHD